MNGERPLSPVLAILNCAYHEHLFHKFLESTTELFPLISSLSTLWMTFCLLLWISIVTSSMLVVTNTPMVFNCGRFTMWLWCCVCASVYREGAGLPEPKYVQLQHVR